MRRIVGVFLLSIAALLLILLSCAGDRGVYEIDVSVADNPSIVGTWRQHYMEYDYEVATKVDFLEDGGGSVWLGVTDPHAEGMSDTFFFDYVLTESNKLTITYADGKQDILSLFDWRKGMVAIQVEGQSEWFRDGIMVRVDE